jgi:hypothetical protein
MLRVKAPNMPAACRPFLFRRSRCQPFQYLTLALLIAMSFCGAGLAQTDDDEFEVIEGQPGLIARFTLADGQQITRIVDRVVLSATHLPLDDRLSTEIRSVRYEGRLFAEFPETFVLAAHVQGRLVVHVNGKRVIDAGTVETDWVDSAPLELDCCLITGIELPTVFLSFRCVAGPGEYIGRRRLRRGLCPPETLDVGGHLRAIVFCRRVAPRPQRCAEAARHPAFDPFLSRKTASTRSSARAIPR